MLARALKIARMGYWRCDERDSGTLWISPELALMYRLPTEEGRVTFEAVRRGYLDDAPAELARNLVRCWTDGQPYVVRGRFRGENDAILDYAVHGEAERDEYGRVVQVSGIVRDVTDETAALARLAQSEQRLADFVSTASDWCWETDEQHRFRETRIDSSEGTVVRELRVVGMRRWDLPVVPQDRERMEQHRRDVEAHQSFRDFVYTVRFADGVGRTVRSSGKPVFDPSGSFVGYRGTATDISTLRETQALLDQRTDALREAQRMGKIGTWSYRLGEPRVLWAPEVFALVGLDRETFDTTHENVLARFLDDSGERLIAAQKRVMRTGGTESLDVRVMRADGRAADFAITCKAEMCDGAVAGVIGTMQDITERKETQRQLEELAYSDPLTGLANRALFKRQLASVLDACFRQGTASSLMLIDLDRFKEVNDSLGHAAGDELLTRVAIRLRDALGPQAFIARLGGDEFAVIPQRGDAGQDMLELGETIVEALTGPIDLANGEAFVGATVGVANLPEDGSTVDDAMRNADLALYMAKEAGRGRAMVFAPAYAQAVEQRLDLGRHLRHAVDAGTLHAHYQAQVELATNKVVGFESLLRWNHPERGPISPAEFIPVAESSGLIVDLGLWVLRESCRQARSWLDQGYPTRTVSVNVSPAQFWNMDFETAVSAVLAETGLPPNLLCLELTESLFLDHSEHRLNRTLSALVGLGVRLALDDFGSGYSSLGYLTRLPFDRLKVDRSFVEGVATRPEKRKLLGGIIALSRGLGLTVVAEGAERQSEVRVLAELGCDLVQGFVFARPVAPEAAPLVASAIERQVVAAPAPLPAAPVRQASPPLAPLEPDDGLQADADYGAAPIGV
ncbi:sensor domain-containing protein [Phreatobacter sp.]|uniref:sensor domain-containing protein n=1 Tax=Phreatobacter sp. TaxID=1966341 RepID=UPI003F6EA027